jgi:hypothetical protein
MNSLISFVFSALLDIPVYESRVQSLHALFTLYLGFKNSEVRKTKNQRRIELFCIYSSF